jgi:hypothetical protein
MISRSLSSFPTLLLTAFPLSDCGPMSGQNPAGQYMPVNAIADGNDALGDIYKRGEELSATVAKAAPGLAK